MAWQRKGGQKGIHLKLEAAFGKTTKAAYDECEGITAMIMVIVTVKISPIGSEESYRKCK